VLYYPKLINENPSIPIYAALISGLIVFGLLFFMRRQSTVTYAKVYEMENVNEHNQFLV